jgi:hypothetical protein
VDFFRQPGNRANPPIWVLNAPANPAALLDGYQSTLSVLSWRPINGTGSEAKVYVVHTRGLDQIAEVEFAGLWSRHSMAMALSYCTERAVYGGGAIGVVVSLETEESATL